MDIKSVRIDIHKEAISIAVMNGDGKPVIGPGQGIAQLPYSASTQFIIEAKAITMVQLIHGRRGDSHVTFDEGV